MRGFYRFFSLVKIWTESEINLGLLDWIKPQESTEIDFEIWGHGRGVGGTGEMCLDQGYQYIFV